MALGPPWCPNSSFCDLVQHHLYIGSLLSCVTPHGGKIAAPPPGTVPTFQEGNRRKCESLCWLGLLDVFLGAQKLSQNTPQKTSYKLLARMAL